MTPINSSRRVLLRMLVPLLLSPSGPLLARSAPQIEQAQELAEQNSHLSEGGLQMFGGMMETFLHRTNLTQDEVQCLARSLGEVAYGAYQSAEAIAKVFEDLGELEDPSQVFVKLTQILNHLVSLPEGFMIDCVHGQALQALKTASMHLANMSYVTGHFIAHGVDIVNDISDAVIAFNQNDNKQFGRDIGRACRKVLLSNASNASSIALPEGPPSTEQIANMSAGIIQGFFGEGFELDIASDKTIVTVPQFKLLMLMEDQDHVATKNRSQGHHMRIHIDLHSCIEKNVGFFQDVLAKALYMFAQQEVVPSQADDFRFGAAVLERLPAALGRCGLGREQQEMLAESMQYLDHLHFQVKLPRSDDGLVQHAAEDLADVAKDWSAMDWFAFGADLGKILQGLVIRTLPHKYTFDGAGLLAELGIDLAKPMAANRPREAHGAGLLAEVGMDLAKPMEVDSAALERGGFIFADEPGAVSGLSVGGVELLTCMAEGFLHRGNLTAIERNCLANYVGLATDGVVKASENMAALFEQLSDGAPSEEVAKDMPLRIENNTLDLFGNIIAMSEALDQSMAACMDSDASRAISAASKHLVNMTYVTGHIVANGADVVEEIKTAVAALKRGDDCTGSRNIGTAFRKILLSNATCPSLPEGSPTPKQIVNVSAGIIQGFFGPGFELDISSDKKIVTVPLMAMMDWSETNGKDDDFPKAENKTLNIHVDLHTCVERNLPFFRLVMTKAWTFMARQELSLGDSSSPMTWLMPALMELPEALKKCGISEEQEEMLMESMNALDQLHVHVALPNESIGIDQEFELLEKAVKDWSKMQWFALGTDLGRMLRGLLLQVFPELYAVDETAGLHKRMAPASGRLGSGLAAGAAVPLLLLALASVVAGRRFFASCIQKHRPEGDIEEDRFCRAMLTEAAE